MEVLAARTGLRVPLLGLPRPGVLREPEVRGMSGWPELTEIERFESHGRLAVRVAGLNGLDPDDLAGKRVRIGDSVYVVEAGYGPSLGEPYALLLTDGEVVE